MTRIDDGGPAFPVITTNETLTSGPWAACPGMTLRDWFAGQALAGLCARPDEHTFVNTATGETVDEWRARIRAGDAAYCYAMADAVLAARKETP